MDKRRKKLHKDGDSSGAIELDPVALAERVVSGQCRVDVDLFGVPGEMHPHAAWDLLVSVPTELIYCVSAGTMNATIEGQTLTVKTGDLLWVRAGQRFRFWRANQSRLAIYRFRLHVHQRGRRVRLSTPFVFGPDMTEGLEMMRRIVREVVKPGEESQLLVRSLLGVLLVHLSRRAGKKPEPGGLDSGQFQAASKFLAESGMAWPSVAQIAGAAGLSADYFSRLFQRTTGKSVRRWIVEERIRAATELLGDPSMSIGQVAERLGYQDLFYFCRQFKQVMGVSPSGFRKRGAV
jgi:AraC-like DNA-binding protein